MKLIHGLLFIFLLSTMPLFSQIQSVFELTTENKSTFIDKEKVYIKPDRQSFINYDIDGLRALLRRAPQESDFNMNLPGLKVSLPNPNGGFTVFDIYESKIMAEPDYSNFPDIRNYIAVNQNNKFEHGRIDITYQGFHAMIFTGEDVYFIDPASLNNHQTLIAYFKKDLRTTKEFHCSTEGSGFDSNEIEERDALQCNSSTNLYSYRMAVAATGEFTSFHGGTVSNGLSAVNTTINRINAVYERDFGVRMILIGNNSNIIYTNGNTDPYTNDDGFEMLDENQANITSVIGSSAYDIGHVVSTGGGGVAGLGVICNNSAKARGVTGSPFPSGDPFDIDYVAHEVGHQFDGNHTFNGNQGSCGGGNRNASTAFEPGSGSTIQAYAGICGSQDIQPNSDAYFTNISLIEMQTHITENTCKTLISGSANTTPNITSFTTGRSIPAKTPFFLDAAASDAQSDPITYCWEQNDLGSAGTVDSTSATKPTFRSFNPTTSGRRYFPRESTVLNNNNLSNVEALPSVARTLKFKITARDNRATGGGVCHKDATINVIASTGFRVQTPNVALTWASPSVENIIWNVAGTTAAPISCANVDIEVSYNNGLSYSIIADNVPNNGVWAWSIPSGINTTAARIRITCSDNIFYDVSNVPFTIVSSGLTCFTFSAKDLPKSISSSGTPTVTSDIVVSGVPPTYLVKDVNINNITGTHSRMADLSFRLTSPNAVTNNLMSNLCTTTQNFNLGFDDESFYSTIPCPPVSKVMYRPQAFLSAHDNLTANGIWRLSVIDNTTGNGGSLDSWSMNVCFTENFVLPLNFLNIIAKKVGESTHISWTTKEEKGVQNYELEHLGADGYDKIGTVNATNNVGNQYYGLIHERPMQGVNYYRIKAIDFNGGVNYSKIVSVDFSDLAKFNLYPNPATNTLTLERNTNTQIKTVKIFNASGNEVFNQNIQSTSNLKTELNIETLIDGVYFIQINGDAGTEMMKFIKA